MKRVGQITWDGEGIKSVPKGLIESVKGSKSYEFKKTIYKIGVQGRPDDKIKLNNNVFYIGQTGILDIEGWKIETFTVPQYESDTISGDFLVDKDFLIDVCWEE